MGTERVNRPYMVMQSFVLACGATDQDNLVDEVVPGPNATLLQVKAMTKTAGSGTGTFGFQVKAGEATPTVVNPATATTFVDADAVAGVIHGNAAGGEALAGLEDGEHLNIATVKAGTVSGNATLIFTLLWQL